MRDRRKQSGGKRLTGLWLAGVLFGVMFLCGCGDNVKLTTGLNPGELFRVEDVSCTEQEARLFLMNQKNRYEAAYGKNIWNVPVGEENLAAYMEEQLKNFLFQLKCMVLMARDRGIALSGEEKSRAEAAAADYLAAIGSEASSYVNISPEELTGLYEEYRLAELLVEQVTASVQDEISDDEARIIEVQQIVFRRTRQGEDGTVVPLTDQEEKEVRSRAAGVAARAAQGDSFGNLQEIYSDEEAGSIRVGRYDVEESWEEAVFPLTPGQVSSLIETDEAFYVVRVVSNLLPEETQANKEVIRERRRAEVFYREYEAFLAGDLLILRAQDGWGKLSFDGSVPECAEDFCAVYEEVFH